jgi:hypothetical protein
MAGGSYSLHGIITEIMFYLLLLHSRRAFVCNMRGFDVSESHSGAIPAEHIHEAIYRRTFARLECRGVVPAIVRR